MVTQPHVTSEVRTVYRSVRGCKLTKHAAYIAAAKALIADACHEDWGLRMENRVDGGLYPPSCDKHGEYQCRFHKLSPPVHEATDDPDGGGMDYYVKVLPRLVRFLKFVDARRA